VSDLTAAQWREIEGAVVNALVQDSAAVHPRPIWAIELGKLRTILKKSRRSIDQNSLLWALYTDALKQGGETLGGWTTADLHEYMLGEYHGWVVCDALGMKRKKPAKRSSRLTKMEFSDFVSFVVQRFAEHGIILELPGDVAA
jgi:hypothetical protein